MLSKKTFLYRYMMALSLSLSLTSCATLSNLGDAVQDLGGGIFGSDSESEPPAPLTEYKPEVEIDVLWKESIGSGKDKQFLKLNLAVSSGKLFAAAKEGLVQARALETGQLAWEFESEYSFSAATGIGSHTVILGTSGAKVVALSQSTGEELWVSQVSSEVLATPVIANGVVIVRTTDGRIVALDESNGSELWSFEKSVPALSIRGMGTPIIVNDKVIAGYANGKLVALQLNTGKSLWEITLAIPTGRSEVERLIDLDTDLIESDGVVYLSSYNGGTAAVSIEDGKGLWRNDDISAYAGLSNDWRYLYLSDSASDVRQIEQRTGRGLWKQDKLHFRSLTAAVVYDDYVVVGDYEGFVHWLARNDGRQLNRIQIASEAVDSRPVVVNNIVYIYAKDGTLAALKARLF